MKTTYTFLFLLFFSIVIAQIPSGYYNSANGSGYTLKTQLHNIIKNHRDNGYSGLWTTYSTSDRDKEYENDNSIIDIYSENPTGTDPYVYTFGTNQCGTYSVEGNCYNREHITPQSLFNSAAPMVSDAHFITPTDGKVNGIRSNYPHGMVNTPTYTSRNGGKLGPNTNSGIAAGYSGTVFEPINEFKGDIARMYFYFATRYENNIATYNNYGMFDKSRDKVFTTAFLNILLAWHAQDPVSAREIARNNAIYLRQNNRNPFIDHPEYVQQIWNPNASNDTQEPTAPSNLNITSTTTASMALSWTASSDNVGVTGYNIYVNDVFRATVSGTAYTLSGLTASTSYTVYITARDAAGNISPASNIDNGTTPANPGSGATELLFSEYIEGSSNNKALEIANYTGNAVNMSAYRIKKQTNGTGNWSSGLALNGTLSNGAKYTIVNSSIASACYPTASANIVSSGTEMTFNGNDAVGLFKNGVLIDIIGTFNGGSANFSIDQTLRRKSSITAPSTTFNKSAQWDVYTSNTCNNLGSRSAIETETIKTTNSDNLKIYPNPSSGSFTISFPDDSPYSFEIYSLLGQKVYSKEGINISTTTVDQLQKGIYMIHIVKGTSSYLKKMIIN